MKIAGVLFVIVILTVVYLHYCTGISLAKPGAKENPDIHPPLADQQSAGHFELVKILEQTVALITYDTLHHYFLLLNNEQIIKINAAGQIVFTMPRHDMGPLRFPEAFKLPLSSCLFDTTGVIDFAAEQPVHKPYAAVLNDTSAFETLYKKAQAVIYGQIDDSGYRRPIYLQINGEWTILFVSSQDMRFREVDEFTGVDMDGYPAHFPKMVLLKDAQSGLYSTLTPGDEDSLQSFVYPEDKIELLASRKTGVFSHAAYSPFANSLRFNAAYRLPAGDSGFVFRAEATRETGAGKQLNTYLHWWRVPAQFTAQTPVSFLRYNFPVLGHEGAGIYVVRRKR